MDTYDTRRTAVSDASASTINSLIFALFLGSTLLESLLEEEGDNDDRSCMTISWAMYRAGLCANDWRYSIESSSDVFSAEMRSFRRTRLSAILPITLQVKRSCLRSVRGS